MGSRVDVKVFAGVSAAYGIISRRGVSTTRRLDTNDRWIHEMAAHMQILYNKALVIANLSGAMTDEPPSSELEKYTQMLGARFAEGRFDIAARMATDEAITPTTCLMIRV